MEESEEKGRLVNAYFDKNLSRFIETNQFLFKEKLMEMEVSIREEYLEGVKYRVVYSRENKVTRWKAEDDERLHLPTKKIIGGIVVTRCLKFEQKPSATPDISQEEIRAEAGKI